MSQHNRARVDLTTWLLVVLAVAFVALVVLALAPFGHGQ